MIATMDGQHEKEGGGRSFLHCNYVKSEISSGNLVLKVVEETIIKLPISNMMWLWNIMCIV